MLRKRAVRELLIEDVAGLRAPVAAGDDSPQRPDDAGGAAVSEAEIAAAHAEALASARRRAGLAVAVDLVAIVVLFALRDRAVPFLPLDGTIDSVFTFGVIVVAVHAGFRLGQLEKYRAVARVWERNLS